MPARPLFPRLSKAIALVLLATFGLAAVAPAGNGPRRLNPGPIGRLYSIGAVIIDGRPRAGEQLLWGGEQVRARESGVRIQLDGVGQVLLYKGSSARLSVAAAPDLTVIKESTLTLTVSAGDVAVSLIPDAGACVVIGETVYKASRGAVFTVRTAGDESRFEVRAGEITRATPQRKPNYILIPLLINQQTNRPTGPAPDPIPAKANKPLGIGTRPQRQQTRTVRLTNASFTAQLGQPSDPIVGLEIEFCLVSNPNIGSFTRSGTACETAKTEQDGIAKVVFQAGPKRGISTVKATVVTSPESFWSGRIEVVPPFWTWKKILILGAVAGGGVICAFKCKPRNNGPLRQVPPSTIP